MSTIALGRCFQFAFDEIMDKPKAKLIHGYIIDPWDGKQILHAWVEYRGKAYDWQTIVARGQKPLTIKAYYKKWKADPRFIYDHEEAAINVLRHKHSGPWEDL